MRADTEFAGVHDLVHQMGLHTVCRSARCPNIHECWGRGTATLMILGNLCTRACRFCGVPAGRPLGLDTDEPRRVGEAAKRMNLHHVVLTSVARDDLADGGAGIFAESILAVRAQLPAASIEVLTPDFQGDRDSVSTVLAARPDVYNHNIETVKRLQAVVRPQASYGRSMSVLRQAAEHPARPAVKSGIMVGLGETDDEVLETMRDLRDNGCELLTLGQYLQPSRHHRPVERFVAPDAFDRYAAVARDIGFKGVASGPMVRSSYKADELLTLAREKCPATGHIASPNF
jgi:lipoic acid synthetase